MLLSTTTLLAKDCAHNISNNYDRYVTLLLFWLKTTFLKVLKTTYLNSIFFSFPVRKVQVRRKKTHPRARLYLIQYIIFLFYQSRDYI